MKSVIVKTFINTVFCTKESDIEYLRSLAEEWTKNRFPEGELEIISCGTYAISDMLKIREMKKLYNYNKNIGLFKRQIMVFLSLYDVHHSVKRACQFISQLQGIGYIVYILTLNPQTPCYKYLNDLACRHGNPECVEPIIRHGKYDDRFIKFAAELRCCSVPVKYSIIEEKTKIPRTTVYSYIQRNNLTQGSKTARDYLTKEEEEDLEIYLKHGSLYDKDV